MRARFSQFVFLVLVFSILYAGCTADSIGIFPPKGKVRIVTDCYGVPHVYAANEVEAMYGLGYCHAKNRLNKMFQAKRMAAGRLSEILGRDYLDQDVVYRQFRLTERAIQITAGLKQEYRELIDAYCGGVNEYIRINRSAVPEWIDSYSPQELTAVCLILNLYFPLQSLMNDLNHLNETNTGSNQFAVASNRSATGHAIMAFDPHMSFTGPFVWMEASISAPDLSIVGCTIPGLPLFVMGHNGHVAWSMTKNNPDITDMVRFQTDPNHPGHYKGIEGWMAFDVADQIFRYKTESGMKEVKKSLQFTHVGPVLKIGNGWVYAGMISGFDSPRLLEQMFKKSKAKTVDEYIQTFRIPGLNMQNQMAADIDGNIGFLDNAILPVRDPSLDWSKPVDGGDPGSKWNGTVPFDALPKVMNPASGWLQNCNDPTWHVTTGDAIKKEEIPFRHSFGSLGDRGKRITEWLSSNPSVAFEDMIRYSGDIEAIRSRVWVPQLISGYEKFNAGSSCEGSFLEKAVHLLKSWDFRCDVDSRCTTLYYYWYKIANVSHIFDDSQITDKMIERQLKNLASAAETVIQKYGRLDVPWGQILYFQHGDVVIPVSGGGGILSTIKLAYGRMNRRNQIPVTIGSSYMMVVELSKVPKACSCFPVGIDENPKSKHFSDMTYMYSKMKFKPVYFSWEELAGNIESDEMLTIQ